MQFAAADCNFAIFEDFMKKTICTILAVIMIVGCFFAFTACNDDAYGKELIENGSFDNGSSGWYIAKAIDNGKDGTTIKKIDDDDNAYLVLNNGSTVGNYVRLYQRVAVKKNGIYKETTALKSARTTRIRAAVSKSPKTAQELSRRASRFRKTGRLIPHTSNPPTPRKSPSR